MKDRKLSREEAAELIAYYMPNGKFIYKTRDRWRFDSPLMPEGAKMHLEDQGCDWEDVQEIFKKREYYKVYGTTIHPEKTELVRDEDGLLWINKWVKPTMEPEPGSYPRIWMILERLCGGDKDGLEWLINWLAFKVQNPSAIPKTAVVFSTSPGAGKSIFFRIVSEMLGVENTTVVKADQLESRFNGEWTGKLFILADELVSSDNIMDISQKLKIFTDANEFKEERKGQDATMVKNMAAWVFASNDPISPIKVEQGDRRYTVFFDHTPLSKEYCAKRDSCFGKDRRSLDPAFAAEIRAFWYDLKRWDVDSGDHKFGTPYDNESRNQLLEATRPAHERFFDDVNKYGIEAHVQELVQAGDWELSKSRADWSFDDGCVSSKVVYKCYQAYVKKNGGQTPLAANRFGAAVTNMKVWARREKVVPSTKKQTLCYVIPKK